MEAPQSTPPAEPAKPEAPAPTADTAEPPDKGFGFSPSRDEAMIPEDIMQRLLGATGYRTEKIHSSGALAFGDNATSIGQAVISLPGAKARRAERSADDIEASLAFHAESGEDTALDNLLKSNHLVCLLGEQQTGRSHTALAALARKHGSDRVVELTCADDAALGTVVNEPGLLADKRGHLLRVPAAKMDRYSIMSLETLARRQDATVIVVSERTHESDGLSRFVHDHRPPNAAHVFTQHLRQHLTVHGGCAPTCADAGHVNRSACATQYVEWCLTTEKVTTLLSRTHRPQEAVALARNVAALRPTAPDGFSDIDVEIAERSRSTAMSLLAVPPKTAVDYVPGLWKRAFRIIYTILDGCLIGDVNHEAEALFELMTPPENKHGDRPNPPHDMDFDTLVPGNMRGKVEALLNAAWNDYPTTQQPLLDWLRELPTNERPLVRRSAAVAAGYFAGFDHELVFNTVITDWARANTARYRQTAGLAVAFAVANSRITQHVLERMQKWVAYGGAAQRDAIARAYAAGAGDGLSLTIALEHLRVIADSELHWESEMIGRGLARLFNRATADNVIEEILRWHRGKDRLRSIHAARTLVELTGVEEHTPNTVWPRLLLWTGDDEERLSRLAELWRNALLLPPTAFAAWNALESWIAIATFDEGLTQLVTNLFRLICADRHIRVRARFYLDRRWSNRQPPYPLLPALASIVKEQQ